MPGPSRNYTKELERLIQKLQQEGKVPRLLLHACCAPCSSAVLEYLSQYFAITLLYYNPNIAPLEEYQKVSPYFEADVYDALSLETCVNGRKVYGGPAPEAVKVQIENMKQFVQEREA